MAQGRGYDAVLRAMFLGMPGIADHFPACYQEALQELLLPDPGPPAKARANGEPAGANGWMPQAVSSYRA